MSGRKIDMISQAKSIIPIIKNKIVYFGLDTLFLVGRAQRINNMSPNIQRLENKIEVRLGSQ